MLMTAVHMDSSSTTTPPPWLPVLHDSAPPPAPSSHHHLLLRAAPAARSRVAKRRPRPSRRLPTTYITADPASFRRMVHQVTGADDLPQPNAAELPITRPAPVRAAAGGFTAPLNALPTLDTSAFLVDALSQTGSDGSAAAPALEAVEAAGAYCNSSTGGGFPTLESWDHHAKQERRRSLLILKVKGRSVLSLSEFNC